MKIFYYFNKNLILYKICLKGHFKNKLLCLFISFLSHFFTFNIVNNFKYDLKISKIPILTIEYLKNLNNIKKNNFLILFMFFINKCLYICKEKVRVFLVYN